MPNLENLRKQAKQFLRWHRDGYYPVAATIREHLPQFQFSSDQEIMAAAFKLGDAQQLVARKEGFRDWQALKAGEPNAMPHTPSNPHPIFTSVAAHLYVRDFQASISFFTAKVGFAVDFTYGDPPFYGEVVRDNARLALRLVDEYPFTDDLRTRESLLSATITLGTSDEIKELFLDFQAMGVSFAQSLRNEPWQGKTFIIQDPDGNLILFAGPAA